MSSLKHRLAVVWLQHEGFYVVQGNMYQSHHFKDRIRLCQESQRYLGAYSIAAGGEELRQKPRSLNAGSIKGAPSKLELKPKSYPLALH